MMKLKIDTSKLERQIKESSIKAAMKTLDQEFADEMADTIRTRTRLGNGVEGDKQVKLDPLKRTDNGTSRYIKKRERASDLSPLTTPKKSNLTFTGQLLDAIKGSVKGLFITIEIKGTRSDGMENSKLREYVETIRPFFSFTKGEKNKIARKIKKLFMKNLARGKK